ncbi:hypothetical protein IQ255_18865 [Pleurocapsales cyanobacterium LEGE 10410]|nr:hypothetical protein [Pleurocapsales cyanobacterium LEGE 10410]
MNQHSSTIKKYYSPLIGAALAAASLFQFSLPVFAVGTEAGLELKNTATGTYENELGEEYNVISNEVTVTVGKVAGITNVPTDFTDNTTTNSAVLPGDSVSFDFEVTNTGNDVFDIFIPDANTLNSNSVNITVDPTDATSVQYSTDGGTTFIDRPATGIIPSVAENDSIIVRVTGTVDSGANVGDTISVQLGDSGNNTADINSPDFAGTQNQPDDQLVNGFAQDPQEADVRTLTSSTATVAGDPVNGQREASATNVSTVGSNPLALARIEKTSAGVEDNGASPDTPSNLTDDIITYNLELDVLDSGLARYTNFPFNPTALEGRDYTGGTAVAGTPAEFTGTAITALAGLSNLILVSDAVPAGTVLSENITAVGDWIPVYSSSTLDIPADEAQWSSDAPADQTARDAITRVGWVYDAEANGAIAVGETVTAIQGGFTFKVRNTTATGPVNIYNIAQTFGSTDDGAAGAGGRIVFDESGDENPNNFNDDGTAGLDETVADAGGNFGVADGTDAANIDTNNDNTAINSVGGEVNIVVLTVPAAVSDFFNGPQGFADAVGGIFDTNPVDDNHDFQNLGVATPAIAGNTFNANGDVNTTYDPASITFTNTITNPDTAQISDVILRPISPDSLGLGGDTADIPTGTIVTITYDDGANPSTPGTAVLTAQYTYNGTSFTLDTGSEISVDSINGGGTVDYTVAVDLPVNTALSTNDATGGVVGGYPVPIVAYIDSDGTAGLAATDTFNVTVDQVYTGYLKLAKQSRILRANDSGVYSVVPGMDYGDPNTAKFPAPGDIIEYQVNYTNISEPQGDGTNNGVLQANDVRITEDGTVRDNNWALDNNSDGVIDTLNIPSSATDTNSGTITYFEGNPSNTASSATSRVVTRYVDFIPNVAPGADGTFTFQREVTDAEAIDELNPTP